MTWLKWNSAAIAGLIAVVAVPAIAGHAKTGGDVRVAPAQWGAQRSPAAACCSLRGSGIRFSATASRRKSVSVSAAPVLWAHARARAR
jgi:hypothetical protein